MTGFWGKFLKRQKNSWPVERLSASQVNFCCMGLERKQIISTNGWPEPYCCMIAV